MIAIKDDREERALALDISKSFIVQAPAGSGKTELLIQRYLTLLQAVQTPEEILAITFTKKAANEMRTRILAALHHANTQQEPLAAHAKKTWQIARKVLARNAQYAWNILGNPNQLRIQTIDALCTYLTKQLPLLSHFGSPPQLADYPLSLYEEAVCEVLTHLEEDLPWSDALAQLLIHLDNDLNKLHGLLLHLLAKRDQWLPYIHLDLQDAEIKLQLESHLQGIIQHHTSRITQIFPEASLNELLHHLGLTAPLNEPDWLAIASLLLTQKNTWRARVDKKIAPVLDTLRDHDELREALAALFILPPPHFHDKQWKILRALLPLLKVIAAQLQITFQQHGQIDFIENAQAALLALGQDENPTDLALALDYHIRHILVDEFQDTSFSQYQLLRKLTTGWEQDDGRSLFVVGDPMQSIYRFRQAEVGLFIRMREYGLGHIDLIPLTLTINFRSSQSIVEWNNSHFQAIFPPFSNMATGAVNYSASIAHDAKVEASEVKIHGFLASDEPLQAQHIINLISSLLTTHADEKIALLVRSRSHLTNIIPLLKKANITYIATDIDSLAAKQNIQDLLALTCALLHPADRIAWLSLLRAPWCGLTLADLLIIAGLDSHAAILTSLNSATLIQQLSVDGQARLKRIVPILKHSIAERERCNLRTWIESTWLGLGGPACLSNAIDIEDANAFFNLLDSVTDKQQTTQIDKLKEQITTAFSSTPHVSDARVHIMTIHTAKGLEFDTVILPHLERKLPQDSHALLSWMEQPLPDNQSALLLAPIHATGDEKDPIYAYIRHQDRIKSQYESDRLFYVATTRAKKRLYLYFDTEQKENGDYKIESGSFLEKIWPHIKHQAAKLIVHDQKHLTSNTAAPLMKRFLTRLAPSWINPIMEKPAKTAAYHQQQAGFQLADLAAKNIGITVHKVLQQLAEQGINWWQQCNQDEQNAYLSTQLQQLGLSRNELSVALQTTFQLIQNTLNDERGLWILAPHKEARCELAITAHLNGKTEQLIIDRTFIDDEGTRWIIDYKTTEQAEPHLYAEKMQVYAEAMRLIDKRPIRLGLYYPAIPTWEELS